tara:strand:+ start:908 stop:1171 length:264 start_codon:yes stop_codon:yes gene_type:complete
MVPADCMALLRAAGVFESFGDANHVYGYFDRSGQPRRIVAQFPSGWRADVRIGANGHFTMTLSSRMVIASDARDAVSDDPPVASIAA